MKHFLLWGMMVMALLSCNSPATEQQKATIADTAMQPAGAGTRAFPAAPVLDAYFKLGSALFAENAPLITAAATALQKDLQALKATDFPAEQQKTVAEIMESSIENAEHIAASKDNPGHQREHFQLLSEDLYDLAKAAGTGTTIYKFVCPALNGRKGGFWLSDQQALKNPYTGAAGNACGTIEETLN